MCSTKTAQVCRQSRLPSSELFARCLEIYFVAGLCLLQRDEEGCVPRCLKSLPAAYHGLILNTCLVHLNIISLDLTLS